MDLSFKLESFEGPMDLLLHLIDKNKVDIMDIPIASITDQYFEYLSRMDRTDLDTMSDFLVMAATLLDIKARLLLPPEVDEEGEEIDPRSELVEKLLEYKMYKYMSFELRGREDEAGRVLYHERSLPPEVAKYRQKADPEKLLSQVTMEQLQKIFEEIMKRANERVDTERSTFGRIEKEKINTREVMKNVQRRILKRRTCSFRSLLSEHPGRMYIVVTFMTVLELMKLGRVEAKQDEMFGDILLEARDESQWEKNEGLDLEETYE